MDEFQILTAFAEILPLTVAIPVFRVAFSQVARPRALPVGATSRSPWP